MNHVPDLPSDQDFQRAVLHLTQGGIVAFPTETFYGLAVDPFNEQALTSLFRLKGRALSNPFPVLIQKEEQLSGLTISIPRLYRPLMRAFWPGPLTLVFPVGVGISSILTGGSDGIGVRISAHPVAAKFGQLWGKPMTATSANLSGMPAACTAAEVRRFFSDELVWILDGGRTPGGMSSTVVGLENGKLHLHRAGVIDFAILIQAAETKNI